MKNAPAGRIATKLDAAENTGASLHHRSWWFVLSGCCDSSILQLLRKLRMPKASDMIILAGSSLQPLLSRVDG
jgi:hypothetical protein